VTFDDDFARLHFKIGTQNIRLVELGLEWPPPERITELFGRPLDTPLVRRSMSTFTDAQRAEMTHVVRGAEYFYERSTV
jgi:hypothetical protein